MFLIINVYFVSYGKGDLEEEKVGRGGMVVGGDIFWVLIKKNFDLLIYFVKNCFLLIRI